MAFFIPSIQFFFGLVIGLTETKRKGFKFISIAEYLRTEEQKEEFPF
jgi:hypothetical protein